MINIKDIDDLLYDKNEIKHDMKLAQDIMVIARQNPKMDREEVMNEIIIREIDDKLFKAHYLDYNQELTKNLWDAINSNPQYEREAVKKIRDKFNVRDTLKGLAIADLMLIDYKNADKIAYQELIKMIYSNKDIARIVIDVEAGFSYFSFLLMSLWNEDLVLNEEQKKYVVSEAMAKCGTTLYQQKKEQIHNNLEKNGTSNDPGKKFNDIFGYFDKAQVHGKGAFDIRYWILHNNNWSISEKQQLIMDFYADQDRYDEYLNEWEWAIVNDHENYKGNILPVLDFDEVIHNYSYEDFYKFYGNEETATRIWNEVNFCHQMHMLRPASYEKELCYGIK